MIPPSSLPPPWGHGAARVQEDSRSLLTAGLALALVMLAPAAAAAADPLAPAAANGPQATLLPPPPEAALLGDRPLGLEDLTVPLTVPLPGPPAAIRPQSPGPAAGPPPAPGPAVQPAASSAGPLAPPSSESPAPTAAGDATPSAPAVATNSQTARRLVLNRRQKLLQVLEGERELRRFPVGVGMPGWETPSGSFAVLEKRADPVWQHPASGQLIPPGPANPLGSRWIGFHRDCNGRRGFNGQEMLEVKGCVTAGFHGTPNRASVGRAVSHGCVRLFDEHARELYDLVEVGTPVIVLP